jgi:uncharacterized protein
MNPLPFNPLRPYLRNRFGREVHRVALDAGSTCPNRDGSKGFGGCSYCDVEGSGTGARKSGQELAAQLEAGIARVRRRGGDPGVIAYFQSYSNTYVDLPRLEEVLSVVEPHLSDPVVAVSIATRPDTLPGPALDLLADLNRRLPVWVEMGLETADDSILERIGRFHTVGDFQETTRRLHAAGLEVIAHAILGFPGDGRRGARRTAEVLAASRVEGVKVHQLMVLRRTRLEKEWNEGKVEPLDEETYLDWLADFIERLGPDQIVHRLTGDAPAEKLLAPRWKGHKSALRDQLVAELRRRGTGQGRRE